MANRRGTHALMTKVRQAEKQLERNELPEKPFEPWELRLTLGAGERPGDLVARLDGAVAERGAFRLGPFELDLRPGERLAVTGPNGSGKSTLLGLLLGTVPLAAGRAHARARTRLGSLEQARETYAGDERARRPLPRAHGPDRRGRAHAAGEVRPRRRPHRPRRRLALARRAHPRPARRAPGARRQRASSSTSRRTTSTWRRSSSSSRPSPATTGTLVVVSHDRRFLERVAPTRELRSACRACWQIVTSDKTSARLPGRSWPSPRGRRRRPAATSVARSTASRRRA